MPDVIETNAAQVASLFSALGDAIGNPEPMLRRTQALIAADEQEVFATQGQSIGASWAPAVQPELKTDSRLLVMTGALMQSVTSADAGEVEGNVLSFSTDVPYAGYIEFGTGRMVARPFMGITDRFARAVEELLVATIEDHFE